MRDAFVPYRSTQPLRNPPCQCSPKPVGARLGFLGVTAPAKTVAIPINTNTQTVALMRGMIARGIAPKLVLLAGLRDLQSRGHTMINAQNQAELITGLANSPRKLGALGIGIDSQSLQTTQGGAATGATVGSAIVPGIGTAIGLVIGAVIGTAAHLLVRHVGKAEASWKSPGFYASLNTTPGREYDERQFSEAFKGMMDTGNNIVPGCGPDRHKNPDCLLGPLANVVAQAYLSGAVPLNATTEQVFAQVVIPWFQTGAGGLINWANLSREPTQLLMMKAATDRYLAGQAMTRGDMPSYQNQGAKTPSLVQVLQPILQTSSPPTPLATPTGSVMIPTQPPMTNQALQPLTVTGTTAAGTPIVPIDQTAALVAQLRAQGDTQQQAFTAAMASLQAQGVNTASPAVQAQVAADVAGVPVGGAVPVATAGGLSGIPQWLQIGLLVVGVGFVLVRPVKHSRRSQRH